MQLFGFLLLIALGSAFDKVMFESNKDRTISWTADTVLPINQGAAPRVQYVDISFKREFPRAP